MWYQTLEPPKSTWKVVKDSLTDIKQYFITCGRQAVSLGHRLSTQLKSLAKSGGLISCPSLKFKNFLQTLFNKSKIYKCEIDEIIFCSYLELDTSRLIRLSILSLLSLVKYFFHCLNFIGCVSCCFATSMTLTL